MPIVSSIISKQDRQIDGRIVVREIHTDDSDNQYPIDYIADVGYDINKRLSNNAQALNQKFIDDAANIIPKDQAIVNNDLNVFSQEQLQLVADQAKLAADQNAKAIS